MSEQSGVRSPVQRLVRFEPTPIALLPTAADEAKTL